ncbi:GumK N-terminal domain-containing glycosyltransferase [Pannonibacter tanglangensis]|uniref:Polysaccharide biosynthesis protein GumK n=1 Tax=Pannonibacter tanglangensis TaxID=2750084 RepID=A0ABW9ZGI8_9HYPH|nr:glycosyltransferase family 1 protein [Pannonibacter sp. XCT-34]NBN63970.1 polysaccharide biosynthesis protein GumK [Pannonibacter sp. XCT-34]
MAGGSQFISVLSAHVFAPQIRKTSVHFISRELAALGHQVRFISVGFSWLRALRNCPRYAAITRAQKNRFAPIAPRLEAGAYIAPVHAFSNRNPLLDRIGSLLFPLYAGRLPAFARNAILQSDVVMLESGTPLAFFDAVRALRPQAKTLYLCRDHLQSVGASPHLQGIERRIIGAFDSVCVPSRRLAEQLPPGGRVSVIPQAVEPSAFRAARQSPYPPGTLNAISVGDMLLDRPVLADLARSAPEVTFHVFGTRWDRPAPANLKVHGEIGFEELAGFIRHADFGIAAYAASDNESYLAESSLKLLQYAHCGLPVILPDSIPVARGNEVTYPRSGRFEGRALVDRCIAMKRSGTLRFDIADWRDNAIDTLATLGLTSHPALLADEDEAAYLADDAAQPQRQAV